MAQGLLEKGVQPLPLLTKVKEAYSFATLDDAYVICAQHLLETEATLFHYLFTLGLLTHRFSVIGKCYSTDPAVYFELKNTRALDVCPSSQEFSPFKSFDRQYEENIRSFVDKRIEKILASGCKKLIVVDDGGVLIETINAYIKRSTALANISIIGVEQTSSGFAKLQTVNLHFPVINVARSKIKLTLEATLIADAICTHLDLALEEINVFPQRALILGSGALGSQVEQKLQLFCAVDSYDPIQSRGSFHDLEAVELSQYDLIIGCSGKEALNPTAYDRLKKGTVLASGSSSDREFCGMWWRSQLYRNNLRNREFGKEGPQTAHSEQATIAKGQGASENAQFEANPTSPKTDSSSGFGINRVSDCHDHLNVNGIYLLNCGFPVNFSHYHSLVDNEKYQLTRALLLSGILQACTQMAIPAHFTELALPMQQMIQEEFLTLYPTCFTCL